MYELLRPIKKFEALIFTTINSTNLFPMYYENSIYVWKLKNCYDPLKILRPSYLLLLIVLLLFRRKKKKKFNSFSSAKNTARGVRFLRGFHMYLFLAQF